MGENTHAVNNYPLVSVCTPTFNRRPFIENMFTCFRNQDYPKDKIEWIIVDDGTDKIKDLIVASNIPQIRYFEVEKKMFLGEKRNYMHKHVRGSIVVYMDDDDYYPPQRISHSVERLLSDPNALCAGSSEIYVYFKGMNKMIQCGPYGPNHATAGTFAFKTKLLEQTKYEDTAALAEERAFLKDYTIPFIQLDPLKSILVFSHEHNTFDKRKMFEQKQDEKYFKESTKTVDTFIQHKYEDNIKKFFMEDIDALLDNYDPGKPNMKPDVLKQISEIEAKRAQMIKEYQEQQQLNNAPIMFTQEGKPPVQLNSQQIVQIVTQQKEQISSLTKKNEELQRFTQLLQTKVIELKKQSTGTGTGTDIVECDNDKNPDNEQLIKQIKILTQRNEIIENKLSASLATNTELKIQLNNLSIVPSIHNTHKNVISNCNPEIVVEIDDDA
jgi:glycosyltransferase involved in cell wall biosynthesis